MTHIERNETWTPLIKYRKHHLVRACSSHKIHATIRYMYTLYVGAPNDTRTLDDVTMKKIKDTTSKYFESYTYAKARGVFKNTEEDMVMITIANAEKEKVYKLGEELRSFLRQDGVGVEHNGVYEQLITK